MKYLSYLVTLILLCSCIHWNKLVSQEPIKTIKPLVVSQDSNYKEINGDPLKVREYTLENGLRVFISPNKSAPRVQTLILVKAGSINDPEDATGLAHYLEHMLFKGNETFGTINYEKEKVEIQKIKFLFEQLKASSDSLERKNIYHQIDSISGVASQYACPNEITQMFAQIGAKGVNAYTSKEYTGYITDVPANQLENWLTIEKERFTKPVLRLFHTELEAVYEEKNITLDKADRRMNEVFMKHMFPNHNYGKQTTIGTVEHLKSPSMFAIDEYFNTYYVPNNMAVFLAGDVNPDSAFAMVQNKFGSLKSKVVPPYLYDIRHQITKPDTVHIASKEAPHLMIGFRFPGAGTKESYLVEMVDMLLNNRTAGLFDLNINQPQKAINSYCHPYILRDYTSHEMGGQPNNGQSLEELKELIFAQINLLKKGEFNEWLLEAVVNDLKKSEINSARSNRNRVSAMSSTFAKNISWEEQTTHFERLSKITKEDIVTFVNEHYHDNYVAVYRHQVDSVQNLQVEKPAITALDIPATNQSEFLLNFASKAPPQAIAPVFVKYTDEFSFSDIDSSRQLLYQKNSQDSLFSLTFVIPIGTKHNPDLSLAFSYAELCGSENLTLSQMSERWYQLGIDFSFGAAEEESYLSISGLSEHMTEGIQLMENYLENLVADSAQLLALKNKIITLRENSLTNKRHILWTGLKNYVVYRENSPYMSNLSNESVMNKSAAELLLAFNTVISQQKEVYYYGPLSENQVKKELPKTTPRSGYSHKLKDYKRLNPSAQNEIFLLDFKMQQAEILFMHKSAQFSKEQLPIITLFNEYFGGSMSSIVFQEIREKKALAYSVYSGYTRTTKKEDPHYVLAYIGTQVDKYEVAMKAMLDLLDELPYDSLKFNQAKEAIKQKYATNRIAEHQILSSYRADKKLGYDHDKRQDTFEQIENLNFADLVHFFNTYIKGSSYRIAILGDADKINLKKLADFGKVQQVNFEDIFPY